jgi:hypothetical protein
MMGTTITNERKIEVVFLRQGKKVQVTKNSWVDGFSLFSPRYVYIHIFPNGL